jgi:hypothetical protein
MAAGEGGSDGAESQQGGTNSSQQDGPIRTEGDVVGPSTSATESGISSRAVWANDGAVEGRHTGRMDRAKLFSLVDAVVPDGRGPDPERFASAALESGFQRLTTRRKRHKVLQEYESVQAYQCANCKRNLASNLAIRPPFEKMFLYKPGPHVTSLPAGVEEGDYFAVYSDIHADQMDAAGYQRITVRSFQPQQPLPVQPLVQDNNSSPNRVSARRRRGARPPSAGLTCGDRSVSSMPCPSLTTLNMPPKVPDWTSVQSLFDMVENPFYLPSDTVGQQPKGPFTPMYMWPIGNQGRRRLKVRFGEAWTESRTGQALNYMFQDYYALRVCSSQLHAVLGDSRFKELVQSQEPFYTDVFLQQPIPQGLISVLRSSPQLKRPEKFATWNQAVVDFLRNLDTFSFNEPKDCWPTS